MLGVDSSIQNLYMCSIYHVHFQVKEWEIGREREKKYTTFLVDKKKFRRKEVRIRLHVSKAGVVVL